MRSKLFVAGLVLGLLILALVGFVLRIGKS
jgi:hypothetical protein